VLETFLPASMQPILEILEQYGFILLMLFIWLGVFGAIISPVIAVIRYLLYLGL
jgi:Zn-dependent protease